MDVFLIVTTFVVLITWYAFYIERYRLVVRKKTVKLHQLPAGLNGLSILHLSDLHLKNGNYRIIKMIKKFEKLNPDLILITGDFVDFDNNIEFCAECLGKLKVKKGIFGVFGNHDYFRYTILDTILRNKTTSRLNDYARMAEVLNNKGISIITNSHKYININGQDICIIGVGERGSRPYDMARALPSVENNSFKILICHYPDVIFDPDISKVDLVLAGHTHGGQIRLPIFGALVNWSKLPLKYASGLSRHNGIILHVSPGFGTASLPLRFLCKPEATLLELSRADCRF